MVTAELNADEIFNPKTFAKAETEKKTSQYSKYIPLISNIELPTKTNNKD